MPGIPWATILTHGPALVTAARQLLAAAGPSNRSPAPSVEARLQQLETTSMESARLLEDIAQQIQALTIAQEQTARRVRIAIAVGVTAVITSIAALIVALAW
jgi:hypothetical protein